MGSFDLDIFYICRSNNCELYMKVHTFTNWSRRWGRWWLRRWRVAWRHSSLLEPYKGPSHSNAHGNSNRYDALFRKTGKFILFSKFVKIPMKKLTDHPSVRNICFPSKKFHITIPIINTLSSKSSKTNFEYQKYINFN